METGKEAPCRRFYQEKNNTYTLKDVEILKKTADWIQEKTTDQQRGIEKLRNDGIDPEIVPEVDDILSPHARRSWWNRPEWYREVWSFASADHMSKMKTYYKNVFIEDPETLPHDPTNFFSVARRWYRMIRNGTYLVSPEKIGQVEEQIEHFHQHHPDSVIEDVPEPLRMLHNQRLKLMMSFGQDWKMFWREVPPLEPWQAPQGLAEPDPHINLSTAPPAFFMTDSFLGSSAIEEDLHVIHETYKSPFWHPWDAVRLFTLGPIAAWSPSYYTDVAISRRENERRTSTQPGMMHRAKLDILFDHTPGWNHATHAWHNGRRLPFLRQVAEEAELMARFPEPPSEVQRPEAIPRHMQPLHQWKSFPDPYYSHFSKIDDVSATKADSMMLDTDGDVYKSTEHISSPYKHTATQRAARRHWLYLQSPEAAQHIYQGTPLPTLREMFPIVPDGPPDTSIDNVPAGSIDHAINRSKRQVSNPLEVAQALNQRVEGMSHWQTFKVNSPRMNFLSAVWTSIRYGQNPEVNDDTTVWSRAAHFVKAWRSIPKSERLPISAFSKEAASGLYSVAKQHKQDLKDNLGISDEKLRYMQQYLMNKEETKQKASRLNKLHSELHPSGNPSEASKSSEILERSTTVPKDGPLGEISAHHAKMAPQNPARPSNNGSKRSYHTSRPPIKRGRVLTMPWTITRHYSLDTTPRPASEVSVDEATRLEVEGFFGGGGLGRKVNVTPSNSRDAALRFSTDPSIYLERARMEAVLQAASRAAAETSSDAEYALPRKAFGRSGPRSPPVSPREHYFRERGHLEGAEAPFPTVGNIGPFLSNRSSSSATAKTSFPEAVWGISKAFGRVLSNVVRNVMDERIFSKVSKATTLSEDMDKVVDWQTKMAKDSFWQRYQHSMTSKSRSVYNALPQLVSTLNVLYQTTHPTNHIAAMYFDPTDRNNMLQLSPEEDAHVLPYVLSQIANVPEFPAMGPGYEERRRVFLEQFRQINAAALRDNPVLDNLWRSALPQDRNWTQALKRIFAENPNKSHLTPLEEKQAMFDRILEDLMGLVSEQKNTAKHARTPLEAMGVADSFVERDAKTGTVIGLTDPASIWTDPQVKYHNPENWKVMCTEFHTLDLEITHNQNEVIRREMDRRGNDASAELSDFECMLFHVQPYVDRLMANPMDPKTRVFYIMKLEQLSEDTLLTARWTPPATDDAWWQEFQAADTRPYPTLLEKMGSNHATPDAEPSSLSELLLQLGLPISETDSFHTLYKSHIDHPFLYVKNDGSFVDMNEDGTLDPLMNLAKGIAPSTDQVQQQSARSPYKHLQELLNTDPLFLAKSWIRTLAHLRYQREVKQTWNPFAQDQELPALISQLEARLKEAKALQSSPASGASLDSAAVREFETMQELVTELSSSIKMHPDSASLRAMPTLNDSGMTPAEYATFGGMVAALDPDCKNFIPPPMQSLEEGYLDAASSNSTAFDSLLDKMQEERDEYESQVAALVASARPKLEVSSYNPYLYMPNTPIPRSRALSTRWRGAEPLILHAPLMPTHIATGLMQYMMSLKRNMASPDLQLRLQAWLSVRPELYPYISRLTHYNERFVKAVVNNEPLPYGEDLEKTFFHWTVTDYVQHYTGNDYINDLRQDQLMALSDLHILLFGNDSEKALLKRQRRDWQRIALTTLEQKIAGTSQADTVSTCPTLMASSIGSEEKAEYTLSQRIRNTLKAIGKDSEGSVPGPGFKPLKVPVSPSEPISAEQQELRDIYDLTEHGALEAKYHHLGHELAAIERYKEENGWSEDDKMHVSHSRVTGGPNDGKDLPNKDRLRVSKPLVQGVTPIENPKGHLVYLKSDVMVESKASLPSEQENIQIMMSRFMQHPSQKSTASATSSASRDSQMLVPKDMLPLAGLDPNDWLKPISAQDMTLQRLHLLRFDPENKSTHGNYPYSWMDETVSDADRTFNSSPLSTKFAAILAGSSRLVLSDLMKAPLHPEDDLLAEQDEGVKLARRVGDPDLIRDARFLFSLRGADLFDHGDERTVRLLEFQELKKTPHDGSPAAIPRRIIMPPEYTASVAKRMVNMTNEDINAHEWIRNRYSSWLGQDPRSSTFNLVTALDPDHAYDGPGSKSYNERSAISGAKAHQGLASQRSVFTDAQIAVPNPSTVWGPSQKSFFDLEQELRFQLALSVPGDIEKILVQEKTNFIKDLEAQLIAYKAMEKDSIEREEVRATQKLEDVEKRLKMIEREMQRAGAVASEEVSTDSEDTLPEESFLDQTVKEREMLLQEREQLKQAAVQISEAKESHDAKDDSWKRLQDALENLKVMSQEYDSVAKQAVADEPEVASPDSALIPVVAPDSAYEKTPEQRSFDEQLESMKKEREEREAARFKTGRQKPKMIMTPRRLRGEQLLPIFTSKRARGKKGSGGTKLWRRIRPPGELTIREKVRTFIPEDIRIWDETYPGVDRVSWNRKQACNIQFFVAQILNGTPQGVRLSCHDSVIPLIERFYREEFPQFVLVGTLPPFCAEERWSPRPEDGAFTTASIWVVPIMYSTEFDFQLVNQVRHRPDLKSLPISETFVGSVFVTLKTEPERNFQVVDFAFDMDIPGLPEMVHPDQEYLTGNHIMQNRIQDGKEYKAPYLGTFAPPPRDHPHPKTPIFRRNTPRPWDIRNKDFGGSSTKL